MFHHNFWKPVLGIYSSVCYCFSNWMWEIARLKPIILKESKLLDPKSVLKLRLRLSKLETTYLLSLKLEDFLIINIKERHLINFSQMLPKKKICKLQFSIFSFFSPKHAFVAKLLFFFGGGGFTNAFNVNAKWAVNSVKCFVIV